MIKTQTSASRHRSILPSKLNLAQRRAFNTHGHGHDASDEVMSLLDVHKQGAAESLV